MTLKILISVGAIVAYLVAVWFVVGWALWRVSDPDMVWWRHQHWRHPVRTILMAARILWHILRR